MKHSCKQSGTKSNEKNPPLPPFIKEGMGGFKKYSQMNHVMFEVMP